MGRKVDRKGRSKTSGKFVMLHNFMLNTPAWLALKPQERAVYVVLRSRYWGGNNGTIGLSVRDAAALCNISKDTAAKSLRRLQELGFIECAQEGAFSMKVRHASEWRLTDRECDRTGKSPTRAYQHWRPDRSSGEN
jgi:hypothetical protein